MFQQELHATSEKALPFGNYDKMLGVYTRSGSSRAVLFTSLVTKATLFYSHLNIHQTGVHHVSLLKPSDVNIVL